MSSESRANRFKCCQFQKIVDQFFHDFGRLIAAWPIVFLLGPLFITCAFAVVIYHKRNLFDQPTTQGNRNFTKLTNYLPDGADSVRNLRKIVSGKWLQNAMEMGVDHVTDINRKIYDWSKPYAYVILVDHGENMNMLTDRNLRTARDVLKVIENIQITIFNNTNISWHSMCQRVPYDKNLCLEHPLITLLRRPLNSSNESLHSRISGLLQYPEVVLSNLAVDNTMAFGSVKVDHSGRILSSKALRLPYLLHFEHSNTLLQKYERMWQRLFVDVLSDLKHPTISIDFTTSIALMEEIDPNGKLLINFLPISLCVLVFFACFCCSHSDWVVSQPWLGFCGVLTATQAIIVSTGVLFCCGFPFIQMVYIMPFLILTVSTDNTFMVLNSWRNTHPLIEAKSRISKSVGGTSVSILITALTDGLSFAVGTVSQFPAVRIFCTYCALAILCTFIYQMTFFVACLALCAKRETANRHCMWLCRVHPRFESENKSIFYQMCCAGGYLSRKEKVIPSKFHSRWISDLVVEKLTDLLQSNIGRLTIILLYGLYIFSSIWALIHIEVGLQLKNLVPYDSHIVSESDVIDEHFSDYGSYAFVVIEENLDYDDYLTIYRLLDLYRSLTNTIFTDKGEFWLLDYLEFNNSLITDVKNRDFYTVLDKFLLKREFARFRADFVFSFKENWPGKEIEAMKFYVRLRNVGNINKSEISKVIKSKFTKHAFSGFVFDPSFLLIDQQDATVQCVTQVVVLRYHCDRNSYDNHNGDFYSEFFCALWIGLSIVSINIGVLGYLALWDVHLDVVSMLTSVMSVGLSVDYVAHVTYHYVSVKAIEPRTRLRKTMYHVAVPAHQSAASTILGMIILGFVDSYMVRTFVKTVILVVTLGLTHGLLFLPVLLSFFMPVDQHIDSFVSNYGRVREYLSTNLMFSNYSEPKPTFKPVNQRMSMYFGHRALPERPRNGSRDHLGEQKVSACTCCGKSAMSDDKVGQIRRSFNSVQSFSHTCSPVPETLSRRSDDYLEPQINAETISNLQEKSLSAIDCFNGPSSVHVYDSPADDSEYKTVVQGIVNQTSSRMISKSECRRESYVLERTDFSEQELMEMVLKGNSIPVVWKSVSLLKVDASEVQTNEKCDHEYSGSSNKCTDKGKELPFKAFGLR